MEKLHINLCNNTYTGLCHTISNVKKYVNNLSFNNIIVVPDKLSLYTEQKLFELLNIPIYFNVTVVGISKLANKIISENNIKYIQCTELESKLLTLLAIQNTSKSFKCFSKKYTLGFIDEIYAKIEQIKSSNCKIEDLLDDNANIGTKLKFEDIQLIYNEYEKLRENKLDSGELLNLYNSLCSKSQSLKTSNVFFVGFESMTLQGLQVLKNTIINANHTEISITAPYNQDNAKLYDTSFFTSVFNLCKEEKIESKTEWIQNDTNQNKLNILNNLFSRKNKFDTINNYFEFHKSSSLSGEILNCIKHINFLLREENIKFKDIAICAPKDIHPLLESELNNLDIDAFYSKNLPLYDYEPISFIFNILKYKLLTKSKSTIINIVQNSLCNLNNEDKNQLLDLINQYSSFKIILESKKDINDNILNFINSIESPEQYKVFSIKDLISLTSKVIKKYNIFEKISEMCIKFKNIGEISLEKSYLQIPDKLNNLLTTLDNIPLTNSLSHSELLDIFEKALKETNILNVPSTINQLFIGDTTDFYFDKKYIFMLCMNEGITPITLLDTGLISDKEITSETIKAKLEPTIKIINKRNKFKTFEILLSAQQKCFLSYHSHSAENQQLQESDFISELKHLYSNIETTDEDYLYNNANIEESKIAYNLINPYNANIQLKTINDTNLQLKISKTLIKNNLLLFKPKQSNIKIDYCRLFFKNNKTSISVIEKYNKCPKCAFYSSALKLVKAKNDKIESNIIGNFIHKVGEVFVNKNKTKLGTLTPPQIETEVRGICKDTLKDESYFSIMLDKNKFILQIIIDECIRFCSFINYEQQCSRFAPTLTEQYFGPKNTFKPIELIVNNQKYIITGFIDRVDEYDNHFRIIDYKTGNTTNSKGKDLLYYGTKIQLFVYSEAIRQNLDKKLFGAFYLPIRNSFSKNDEGSYHLSGFFINNLNLVKLCDNALYTTTKSPILNCSLNKDGESVRKANNILTEEQLNAFIKYSIEIVKQTIKNIENGFIECSPFENSCDLCEFNTICKMANEEKIVRKENYDIKSDYYLEINYD